ncbi:hypothetical protein COOONC_26480 [Cooperia oncophora]
MSMAICSNAACQGEPPYQSGLRINSISFRKQKLLLLFSLGSLIVFTLAIGFVQPITPYCVVLVPGLNTSCQMMLVPASKVIRGGALGMLKEAVVGRTRRGAENQIIEKIIDLSSFDNEEDIVAGMAPEYITSEQVGLQTFTGIFPLNSCFTSFNREYL